MTTLSRKGRLAVVSQVSWGTAESSFAATDFLECNAPWIPPLARESLTSEAYKPGLGNETPRTPGSKAPVDVQIAGDLHGWSTATPTGSPTSLPDAILLGRALGGITTGNGYTTALAAGGTMSIFKYTEGAASVGWEGYAQNVPIATGRAIGWLANVDTTVNPDQATLAAAITAPHSSSGTMYGSIVAYSSRLAYDQTPLTFQWLGSSAADQIRYFDAGVRSYTLTLENKKVPTFSATLAALDWTAVGSGGAPTDYAYNFPKIPAWTGTNGARAYLAGVARCYQRVVIIITQDLVEAPCHSSNQGVSQWYVGERKITIETFRVITDSSATTALAPGDTPGVLQIDLATTPGRSASIFAGATQILEQPTIVDIGGILGERVLYGVNLYAADDSSTAPANTDFRIGFM